MKLSNTNSGVSVTLTGAELKEVVNELRLSHPSQVRAQGWLNGRHDGLVLTFGHAGRAFTPESGNSDMWRVCMRVEDCNAHTLDQFGATPTTWSAFGLNKIKIAVPAVKSAVRRHRSQAQLAQIIGKRDSYTAPVNHVRRVDPPLPTISDEEMKRALDLFNRAIESGYRPQFDARGRILFFDRQVGGGD